MSHDTLVHRDTFSVVRRLSKAKTDCERFVRLWLLLVVTIARKTGNVASSKNRADAKPTSPLCTALNEPPHQGSPITTRHSPLARFLPIVPTSSLALPGLFLSIYSQLRTQIRTFIVLLFITCFLLHMFFYGFVKYSSYAH